MMNAECGTRNVNVARATAVRVQALSFIIHHSAFIIALLLPGATHAAVAAQDYPTKPVRIVVPFSAGSGSDVFARTLGPKFTEAWGQQIVVENREGAGGIIGAQVVAKAAPD